MNERIKEFAEQAGFAVYGWNENEFKQLADLIVKKCVSIVAAHKDQAIEDGCNVDEAMSAAETYLLDYFGVEP
jgi:hypothetical protein